MRGIVISAGGPFASRASGMVRMLRGLGCELPVELWHMDHEDIPVCQGATIRNGGHHYNGWALKGYAVDASDFDEVLLLDADAEPERDPTFLFDLEEYEETGALFWPDIVRLRTDAPIWRYMDVIPRVMPSFESGQVVINKARHRGAMSEIARMNADAAQVYKLIYGDKDTWLMGMLKACEPFALCPHAPEWCRDAWYQHDWDGHRLFRHPRS